METIILNTYTFIGSNVVYEQEGTVNISASTLDKAAAAAKVYFTTVRGFNKTGLIITSINKRALQGVTA